MVKRFLMIAAALALIAPPAAAGAEPPITWSDVWSLKPSRPPRPKPIEPDAPNNGPFRLDPAPMPDPVPQPTPQATTPAQLYEMADAFGRRWSSPDPGWLQQWVAAQAPRPQTRIYRGTTVCGPGGCPPR